MRKVIFTCGVILSIISFNGSVVERADAQSSNETSDTRGFIRKRSQATCAFLTRPSMENDGEVMRTNTHQSGSRVCFQKRMLTCEAGAWKDYGDCTSFKDWQKLTVDKVEGSQARINGTGSRGSGAPMGAGGGGSLGVSLEELMNKNDLAQEQASYAERRMLAGNAQQAMEANGAAQDDYNAGAGRVSTTSPSSWQAFNSQLNQQAQDLYMRKNREAQVVRQPGGANSAGRTSELQCDLGYTTGANGEEKCLELRRLR